jgi:hypothetical protein
MSRSGMVGKTLTPLVTLVQDLSTIPVSMSAFRHRKLSRS